MAPRTCSVGSFLTRRLLEAGIGSIFGVPGDFALALFQEFTGTEGLQYIGTCNELNAAYAADGYARINGIGALATTYAVGELSAINGVAGAFSEGVPVVCIVGCPSSTSFHDRPLLHHTLGDYTIPKNMFVNITCYSCIISSTDNAVHLLDEALYACLKYKKPVYVGICSDIVKESIVVPDAIFRKPISETSDPLALEEALKEASNWINTSKRPVFIPGRDINRFGLEGKLLQVIESSGVPYATMLMGKAVISEEHPQHLGLYCGKRGREYVRNYVEGSDCVVLIGEKMTDFNTGGFTAAIKKPNTIDVKRNKVVISCHSFQDVYMHEFLEKLSKRLRSRNESIETARNACVHRYTESFQPSEGAKLTMARFFSRIAHFIPEGSVVIAETGASLFSISEVLLKNGVTLIEQSFYGSIGFTLGACLGACIAQPQRPVILFIGDGSFQVVCQELSTLIRFSCKPLIFLINNDGYTIERVIVDGVFNDIQPWRYSKLPEVFGLQHESAQCRTEDELEKLLSQCDFSQLTFAEIFMDRMDCNESLRSAGASMAHLNKLTH